MKQALYLETSVIGAYLDNGEPFRRDLTIRWWEHEMPDYRTVISEKLSQQEQLLDLLQPSKMRVFGAAGVTEDVKLLQLPRLSLGLSKLEKISAAVLDLEPVNETAGFTQSGILGGNFLRHLRIYFDFARGAMRLEPLNQKPKSVENINPEVVVTP